MRSRHWYARLLASALVLTVVLCTAPVRAQLSESTEEKLKFLTDPEALKKKVEKEKARPPFEYFRSQVAPFEILPYVKPNHWFTLSMEARANYENYVGLLQSDPVPLLGMPQQVVIRRDARLTKEQRVRLGLQMMLPKVPREFTFALVRPDAIRPDELWPAALRPLEPHQMLLLPLTKEGANAYNTWNRLQALNPITLDRTDPLAIERRRYYRMVPERPFLSPHPLAWSTISHVIWDAMSPDGLNVAQQQALLDWVHWGGQLVILGGSAASYELLRDSFLNPYLPAEPTGESGLLKEADLAPLSASYPPLSPAADPNDPQPIPATEEEIRRLASRYRAAEPIIPASNRPLFVAGLRPKRPTATIIPLGAGSPHVLGIEERIGRGRILMLTVSLTDPALAAWPGVDTLIRRVVLRRPEDPVVTKAHQDQQGLFHASAYAMLSGPELSWVRYLGRDIGSAAPRPAPYGAEEKAGAESESPAQKNTATPEEEDAALKGSVNLPVAEWVDSSLLPSMSRTLLKQASGISIPSSTFVLKVILAYLVALVPLNWLICRYLLGRREWAWVVVPVLSLGFAVGVERAAAYDIGYDLACDEIDVLEVFGGYPRAHVNRFASLYSTGRVRFSISYPNDPTALVLPMLSGTYLRGEENATAVWRSAPYPALEGYTVQPRTLGMFRAEQMANLPGLIALTGDAGARRIVNDTEFELRDAVLVELDGPKDQKETALGTIAPRSSVEVGSAPAKADKPVDAGGPDRVPVLEALRKYFENRPENHGEVRLVAWVPQTMKGQRIEPAVDRHRGFTAVVVHLRFAAPPSPEGATYYEREPDKRRPTALQVREVPNEVAKQGARGRRGRPGMLGQQPAQAAPASGAPPGQAPR